MKTLLETGFIQDIESCGVTLDYGRCIDPELPVSTSRMTSQLTHYWIGRVSSLTNNNYRSTILRLEATPSYAA